LYWSERIALALCGVCLVYFLFGKLFYNLSFGVLLWNKMAGATAGFSAGLLLVLTNLFHLSLHKPLQANFTATTAEIDRSYAAQGFKPIPVDIQALVTSYERYLDPALFSGPRGYVVSAVLGAVVCLGSVAVLELFP